MFLYHDSFGASNVTVRGVRYNDYIISMSSFYFDETIRMLRAPHFALFYTHEQ